MPFRTCFSLLPLLALLLTPAHGAPRRTDAPPALSCTGVFARSTTHARLVKAFGAPNVVVRAVGIGEGETVKASVIFPRDKARRIEVLWRNEKARRDPAEIRIGTGSARRTTQGVALEMTLAQVEALNGRPFQLYGFGFDYGGTTIDWQGGALATQPGGCTLGLRFDQRKQTDADIVGERSFLSNDPGMRSADPAVEAISLRFGD